MRADYVDRFQGEWTGGLKRMVTQGAWFQQAAYPVPDDGDLRRARDDFDRIVPAHARRLPERVVGSRGAQADDVHRGSARHGRRLRRAGRPAATARTACRCRPSPIRCAPQRQAHVVSLSLKARSAIMLGGHGGDAVTWLTEHARRLGNVARSTPRRRCRRSRRSSTRTRSSADFGKTWDALLPAASYSGPDDGVGEAPPPGWTRSFPHVLKGTGDSAGRDLLRAVGAQPVRRRLRRTVRRRARASRCSSASTTAPTCSRSASRAPTWSAMRSARAATKSRTCTRTSIRRSARCSIELDALVGKDQWVAGLSADHGVTPIPEQLVAEGKDAGRINGGALVDAIEQALKPALGQGAARHRAQHQRHLFRAGRLRQDSQVDAS